MSRVIATFACVVLGLSACVVPDIVAEIVEGEEPSECTDVESCELDCLASGNCHMICTNTESCNMQCSSGCSSYCEGSGCELFCAEGDCSLHCRDAEYCHIVACPFGCSLICDNVGDCQNDCADPSSCSTLIE